MLIYNQNIETPILEPSITIPDLYEDKDIDTIFSNFITNELKNKSFDILFIPLGLSENYMEFLGLRLAYHIRLSKSDILGEKRNIPIVLFGDLTPYAVNKITPLGEILFTEGIHYSKENKESLTLKLEQHNDGSLAKLANRQKFIERIRIEPPANYGQSQHSIANEWAITRIAKTIGKENELRSSSAFQNAQNFLYYKYLNEKYNISSEGNFSLNLSLTKVTSILYIDDEYEKGWKDLLTNMFHIPNITFETLEENFKNLGEQQKIIEKAIEKIKSNPNYDIILLDLRLHDVDFEQTDITKMTGYKILKEMRKMDNDINKGISVVIFTASNKAWNYKTLMDIGADGYFIKESPENSIDENYTVENLMQFQITFQNAVAKTTLLKPYWDLIAKIKNQLTIQNKPSTQIEERIKERLDMFFGLLKKGFERNNFDESLFHYSDYELAFLTLWSVFNEAMEGAYEKNVNADGELTWKLLGTGEYLLNCNQTTIKDSYDSKVHSTIPIPRFIISSIYSHKNIWKLIEAPISFFLYKKRNLQPTSNYFQLLNDTIKTRNHIYLTHGGEIGTDFFEKTEKEKRLGSLSSIHPHSGGDIHKLFNLVAFVLTGDATIKLT